jgi:hypothetical protein
MRKRKPGHWKRVASRAWRAPGWKEAALEYTQTRDRRALIVETPYEKLQWLRELMDDDVSFTAAYYEIQQRYRTNR